MVGICVREKSPVVKLTTPPSHAVGSTSWVIPASLTVPVALGLVLIVFGAIAAIAISYLRARFGKCGVNISESPKINASARRTLTWL